MRKILIAAMAAIVASCGMVPVTVDVGGGKYYWSRKDLSGDVFLSVEHISGPEVNVFLVNKENFNRFQNDQDFRYYPKCSQQAMRTALECEGNIDEGPYYLIVQNKNLFESAQVHIQFY